MQERSYETIHRLWDRLPEYPASQSNKALQFLLETISDLIDADHGYWLSAIRMQANASDDLMLGWRPGPAFYYKELPDDRAIYKSGMKEIEEDSYEVGESTLNHLKQAGEFRATLLRDLVSPAFFDSAHYRAIYQARNITDTLFVVAPVNRDAEVYFCFNRIGSLTPFEQAEIEIASHALRGLKWFHTRMLLSHGLLVAEKPLTPTEKRVMRRLLTDLSEKRIAEDLQQKTDTTHKHILSIYRKFNVNSRAGLMAIWLGLQAG